MNCEGLWTGKNSLAVDEWKYMQQIKVMRTVCLQELRIKTFRTAGAIAAACALVFFGTAANIFPVL